MNTRLKFYTDNLYIDQLRHGVNAGGRMTRKRTLHDLRKIAKRRLTEWWARIFDEILFMYISGARGINTDYVSAPNYGGRANNPLVAPDAQHIIYGSAANNTKASMTPADKMSLGVIERLVVKATMMGGGSQQLPQIQPVNIDGEEHYILLMNPFQAYDMRTNATAGQWLDIQKAAAAAEGRANPMFKGALGMYNNVLLHTHKSCIRFGDYGGGTVAACRALFMGVQAGAIAFGSPGTNMRFDWHEEMDDRGNQLVVDSGSIFGVKKCSFAINGTSTDFGVIAVDTAAADPG